MPSGFFNSMTARLTVLDLSHNEHIQSFPEEICNMIGLQYLNLSNTSIDKLPEKIKNLTCLQWLLVDYITSPALIPTGAIANLPLNLFSQWNLYSPGLDQVREQEIIGELEHNQHLTDLSIDVFKSSSARKIFQSPNLQRSIRRAWITDSKKDFTCIVISDSPTGRDSFSHLEELYLYDCPVLVKMEITQGIGRSSNGTCFPSLAVIKVESCGLSDLSWFIHAPKLRMLMVCHCNLMEKIIGDGFALEKLAASGLFSRLKSLTLSYLPNLKSICDHTLFFPKGLIFHISECPHLEQGSFTVFAKA